jgi:hypothetical protein
MSRPDAGERIRELVERRSDEVYDRFLKTAAEYAHQMAMDGCIVTRTTLEDGKIVIGTVSLREMFK